MQELEEAFKKHDKGKKNFLRKNELKLSLIWLLGYKLSETTLMEIQENQRKNDEGIVFERFIEIWAYLTRNSEEDKAKEYFKVLDLSDQGWITYPEWKKILEKNKVNFLPESKQREVFRMIDYDRDNKITYLDMRNFFTSE